MKLKPEMECDVAQHIVTSSHNQLQERREGINCTKEVFIPECADYIFRLCNELGRSEASFHALHLFSKYTAMKINNRLRTGQEVLDQKQQLQELTMGAICCVRIGAKLSSSEPLRARGKEPIFNSKHHSAIGGQLLQSEVNVLQTIDYETTYTTNYDVMQFLLASFRPSQTAEERMAMGAHCNDLLELAMFTSGYFSTPGACAAGVIAVAEYLSPGSADSDSTVAILMQLTGYAKGDIELCAVQLIDYLISAYRATN